MWQQGWKVVVFISLVSSSTVVSGDKEGEEGRLRLQLTDYKTGELEFRSLKPLPTQTVAWWNEEKGRVSGHYQPLQGCVTSSVPIHGGALHIMKCPVKREQWPFEEMSSAEPNPPSSLHVCCSDTVVGGLSSSLGFSRGAEGWCRYVHSTSPPPRVLEPVRQHLEQRAKAKTLTGSSPPQRPINVLVVGEMDTGKSTLVSFLKSGCRADERPVKHGMCAGGKSCTTLVRTFDCVLPSSPPSSSPSDLPSSPPLPLFRVTDLWGIDWNTPRETLLPGVAPNHLGLLLDGKIPDGFDKNSTWGRGQEWEFFLRQLITPDVHTRTPHIVSFQVDAVPLLNYDDDWKLRQLAKLKDALDFQARGIEVVVSVSRIDKALRDRKIPFPHGQMDSCKVTSLPQVVEMKKRIAHAFNLQPSSVYLWQPYVDEETRSLHHERHLAKNLLDWMDLVHANAPHRPVSLWERYADLQRPLLLLLLLLLGVTLGGVMLSLLWARRRSSSNGAEQSPKGGPTPVPVGEGEGGGHSRGTPANVANVHVPDSVAQGTPAGKPALPAAAVPATESSRREGEEEGEEGGVSMRVFLSSSPVTDRRPAAYCNPLADDHAY